MVSKASSRPSNKEGGGRSGWPFQFENNRNLNAKENAGAAGNPVSLRAVECRRGEAEVSVVRNLSRSIDSFQTSVILRLVACTTTCVGVGKAGFYLNENIGVFHSAPQTTQDQRIVVVFTERHLYIRGRFTVQVSFFYIQWAVVQITYQMVMRFESFFFFFP